MNKHLRKIDEKDLKLLFNWRNHPKIRMNSFDKGVLSLNKHRDWFNNFLKNKWITGYIFEINDNPVGTIRFDFERKEIAKVNYLIDPSHHGKGFGTEILMLGVKEISKDNLNLKKVYGYVLKENLASIRIFEKLSFTRVSENETELKFEKLLYENRE